MKAIIQAYNPGEVERIARGEQTIKICKTAPKDAPFKVYMYKKPYAGGAKIINETLNSVYDGGKVVGEYVCDKVVKYKEHIEEGGLYYTLDYEFNEACQLDNWELHDYGKGKPLYGLHISNLIIYDNPKKLTDFNKPCVDKYQYCQGCKYGSIILSADEEEYAFYHRGQYEYFDTVCHNYVSCPPRNWRYVEELEE